MTRHAHITPEAGPATRLGVRRLALVAFDGMQALDLVGPLEVFTKANAHAPKAGAAPFRYEIHIASPFGGDVTSNSGMVLAATRAFAELETPLDTILVAGGSVELLPASREWPLLLDWLREQAGRSRRLASVCTGAFILGAAGLLDGRRATTHWAQCARLQEMCATTRVEADALYVADGNIYTSAGVTAGIDLALALVEQDLGPAAALSVARDMVLYLRRPGGQSQFSANLAAQAQATGRFQDLLSWIVEHPAEDLTVPALAERAAMSERNFGRAFKAQTGMTPSDYVELVRIDRAKMHLEGSSWPLARIASRCGFGTVSTLIRAFRRRLGITPEDYRERFRLPAA